jgi:multidrug resistance efflux pump
MFDSYREIQARVHRQLAALDELIVEADREIARLQTLLEHARRSVWCSRALSREEQQRAFELWEAGATTEEIAQRLDAAAHGVEQALDEFRWPESHAA